MGVDTPAGPVLLRPAPAPEPGCLPMLHIAAPHHPLDAAHVRQVRRCSEGWAGMVRGCCGWQAAARSAARSGGTRHPPAPLLSWAQALAHAQAGAYNALRSNCIAFADYAVRVLTGGAVRGAPLAFDLLVGQVRESATLAAGREKGGACARARLLAFLGSRACIGEPPAAALAHTHLKARTWLHPLSLSLDLSRCRRSIRRS